MLISDPAGVFMVSRDRESEFQDRLKEIFKEAIRGTRFDGITFDDVRRNEPVDNREADIVLFYSGGLPFLVVETKRKGGQTPRAINDPTSAEVMGQAISYVYLYKRNGLHVPFFGAATPTLFVIFRTPENLNDFVDSSAVEGREYARVIPYGRRGELLTKHVVVMEKPEFRKEWAIQILETLAKEFREKGSATIGLSWALINRLRSFVDELSEDIKPLLSQKVKEDKLFISGLEKLEKELGFKPDVSSLARMMTYVFMNKLIFYKVLERKYRIPRLAELPTSLSGTEFKKRLDELFDEAVLATNDFEPILKAGILDHIPIPDDPDVLEKINGFIAFIDYINIEELGDALGYIYQELISPIERHQLGQFYTPPSICELIARWAIRGPDDLVLDPGCGSGGFIIKCYDMLARLKCGRLQVPEGVHERILNQLYAVDINPFPAHLTAMNLAMRNVRVPSTNMNVVVWDFFALQPKTILYTPYTVKTAAGTVERKIQLPEYFDAVVGNPPYTRWSEIPEPTQKLIRSLLADVVRKYELTPRLAGGVEPGIYVYWIMHAERFLKENGRLAMIISNLWLQTEYGIKLGNFILDHFKVVAVIDFAIRLFDALTSTCIILLEKCSNEEERKRNEVVYIRIPGQVVSLSVDELLEIIEKKSSDKYYVKVVKQGDMPRDKKWLAIFAGKEIFQSTLLVNMEEMFEPIRGNTVWSLYALSNGYRPDPGSSDFYYLSPSKIKEHRLEPFVRDRNILHEAITSAEYAKFFTFTKDDWEELKRSDKRCYMFIGHVRRDEAPKEVKEYIKMGETEIRTKIRKTRGGGRLASETEAAKVREKTTGFYGWYDLGGVVETSFFAVYQAWHKTRFILCKYPVALYHALISFKPKVKLSENQLKALLAYLNSSFAQYYIELNGRRSGGGIIGLEVNIAKEMPILDVRKLTDEQVIRLAGLFDKLESTARSIGGAVEKEQVEKLLPVIKEIDEFVGNLLELSQDQIRYIQETVDELVKRRQAAAKEPKPEAVKGMSEVKKLKRSGGRKVAQQSTTTLLEYMKKENGTLDRR
jgi:type I restriction-modification system DNA methylase subunit